MQVFYVNIGGGEPTIRPDFWHLLRVRRRPPGRREVLHQRRADHPRAGARSSASTDYVDVQISLDGATAEVNDYVRGPGSYDTALTALQNLHDAGFKDAKISVVCTRQNIGQLDEFKALADRYGATLRLTRLRPSRPRRGRVGRAAPAARAAARALRLADGARRERADRRLVLPPRGVRRVACPGSTCAAPAGWSA